MVQLLIDEVAPQIFYFLLHALLFRLNGKKLSQ